LTLKEAAEILGVSKEAVRKRVIRGTLRSDMGGDGRRYVYLDSGGDETPTPESSALISEMRDRIRFLEDQLQRKDAILLNMTEAMKALSPPERESPQTVEEEPETAEPHPAAGGPQEGVQRPQHRPWWRRWLRLGG
jgi:excisionase family DNA binding protein